MAASVSIQYLADGGLDLHALAVWPGYLGATLGVLMVVPQLARTYRDRTTGGVSSLAWALTAFGCFSWLLYGLRADEFPQVPGNILIVSGALVVAVCVPAPLSASARAAVFAAVGLVLTGFAIVAPPQLIGYVALCLAMCAALPQTFASLTRPRDLASGVSVSAWLLRAASQLCWLGYALMIGDHTVVLSALFILTNSLVLVAVESRRRMSVPDAEPVPVG